MKENIKRNEDMNKKIYLFLHLNEIRSLYTQDTTVV